MVISVSNENEALKICNPDVRKVNTSLFDFFIGQVCEKWLPLISASKKKIICWTFQQNFHVASKLPATKYTLSFQCLAKVETLPSDSEL